MKRVLLPIFSLAALVLFALGLYHLFQLRYENGDIYPEYSSLRADPLGTMALFEALDRLPGISTTRDHSAENQLPRQRATAYLHLAASRLDWASMEESLLREVEGFVSAGGRLVITFLPDRGVSAAPGAGPTAVPPGKKQPAKAKPDDERRARRESPQKAWGFEFGRIPIPRGSEGGSGTARATRQAGLPLPEHLRWHSANVFTNLDSSWRTIYARETAPVLIERKLGLGTIVMATDTYFLSNEALLNDRQPELLAWVVGPSRTVLFDEAHLGIVQDQGVAVLVRKYRLEGLVAGLLLLAGLFIWQNASPFPPPLSQPPRREPLQGKDAAAGFINLLRRNIPPGDILRVCFDEWTKSLPQARTHSIARVDAAQAVIESENARARTSRDPVRSYREVCAALKAERK